MSEVAIRTPSRVLKNLVFHSLNIGSTFLLLTVSSVLTARLLGTAQMGQYGLITTFTNIVINAGTLGLADATSRLVAQYLAQGNPARLQGFVRLGLLVVLVISLVFALSIYTFALPLSMLFFGGDFQTDYFALTAVLVVPAMLGSMFSSILAGLQRYDLIAIVKIVTTLPQLLMTVLVLQLHFGINGLLVVTLLVNVTALAFWYILTRRVFQFSLPGQFNRADIWKVTKLSFSLFLMTILNIVVWQRSEVFILSISHSDREVGLYVVTFVLSSVFATLLANILHVLVPTLAGMVSRGDMHGMARLLQSSTRFTALVSTPIIFGGLILARPLLGILYGWQYQEGLNILRILFVATLASVLASGPGYTIVATAHTIRPFIILMFGLAVLNISLDLLIIPAYGGVGAACCNTTVQLIAPFAYDRLLRRMHGFGLPGRQLAGIIGIGLAGLLPVLALEALVGGIALAVVGAVFFTLVYLYGVIRLRLVYREDLAVLLRLVRRLHLSAVERRLLPLSNWLLPEPLVDESKLKYEQSH